MPWMAWMARVFTRPAGEPLPHIIALLDCGRGCSAGWYSQVRPLPLSRGSEPLQSGAARLRPVQRPAYASPHARCEPAEYLRPSGPPRNVACCDKSA